MRFVFASFVLLFVVVVLFCVEKMREKRTLLFALNDENVREGRLGSSSTIP